MTGADSCIIRNYCSADLAQYIRLHAEAESICHSDETLFLASLTGQSPIGFSEEDLFLAEREGTLVGACRVVPELVIDRVVLRLSVAPSSLGRGVAAGLLRSALERADALEAAKVHADLREKDSFARDLFDGFGFSPVRRYTVMRLALRSALMFESDYEGLTYRALERGAEAEFAQLQNNVFGGAWGFCPNTTAEIVQQLNAPGYDHDGVRVAYQGEKAVGYCWTAQVRGPDLLTGAVIGLIHMMGVAPEFRNRGLGWRILSSGLKHLAGKGVGAVELTVDNENAAACSLYERAGFKPKTALLWYEKAFREFSRGAPGLSSSVAGEEIG